MFLKIFLSCIFITLFGCGSSEISRSAEVDQNTIADEKIFKLNLVDLQLSDQGGIAKLSKKNNFCRLHVELLSSYGKEVYNFKFSLLSLVETNHFIYKYEGGIVDYRTAEDKELTELMAEPKDEHVISNELQLINKETVLGHKNININKNFEFYLNLFPNDAVLKRR